MPLARSARDRATADSARSIDFPYCRHCVDHVARWDSAGVMSAGLSVLGVVLGIVMLAVVGIAAGVASGVTAIAIAFLIASSRRNQARHAMRESCSSPGKAVEYLGWTGTSSGFRFESMPFAAKFAEQNAAQLVEEPRLRKLLERYKLVRIAVPTPSAAVSTIPPPPDVGGWIALVAKSSGRVARRAALSRALDALREPREREQVIRAISAIEVEALVSPLERMATVADKLRHLRQVIEQTRYDNIPEALQQEMMRELEDRLAKLQ